MVNSPICISKTWLSLQISFTLTPFTVHIKIRIRQQQKPPNIWPSIASGHLRLILGLRPIQTTFEDTKWGISFIFFFIMVFWFFNELLHSMVVRERKRETEEKQVIDMVFFQANFVWIIEFCGEYSTRSIHSIVKGKKYILSERLFWSILFLCVGKCGCEFVDFVMHKSHPEVGLRLRARMLIFNMHINARTDPYKVGSRGMMYK